MSATLESPPPPTQAEATTLQAWLQAAGSDERERLGVLDHAWSQAGASLARDGETPESIEQARVLHLQSVERLVAGVNATMFPLNSVGCNTLQLVLGSLRRARGYHEQLHGAHVPAVGDAPAGASPDASPSPSPSIALAALLPLARALDYQARLLCVQMLHRIETEATDWITLCRLVRKFPDRPSQDLPVPDDEPLMKNATPRGLFSLPLLLRLARPGTRESAEMAMIERIARQSAGRIGFRIDDDGRLHENRHGPTLPINAKLSVRLDTHRLLRRLDEWERRLQEPATGSDVSLPRGWSRDRVLALIASLRECWGGGRPLVVPTAGEPQEQRVRFGLATLAHGPVHGPADGPVQGSPSSDALVKGAAASSSQAYSWGRYEQNTVVRIGLGVEQARLHAVELLMQSGEHGTIVARDASRCVLERHGAMPLRPGLLVAMLPRDARDAGLLLGRVGVLSQTLGERPGELPPQRLVIDLWVGQGQLIGLQVADAPYFEDCFLLVTPEPSGGQTFSLFVAPGSCRPGATAVIRLKARDLKVRFDKLLERGAGFEHVQLRVLQTVTS